MSMLCHVTNHDLVLVLGMRGVTGDLRSLKRIYTPLMRISTGVYGCIVTNKSAVLLISTTVDNVDISML